MDERQTPFGETPSLVHEIDLGVISMWSGSIGSIPSGWFLCDGTNGTPDLRDRFALSSGPVHGVGSTGGSVNHTHNFTSDGHVHEVPSGTDILSGGNFNFDSLSTVETGTTDAAAINPPFYALAYIQFNGV